MNTIISVLMGTGTKVYLNYGVAEGQNLKPIRIGFYAESFTGKYEIYKANTLCSVHTVLVSKIPLLLISRISSF